MSNKLQTEVFGKFISVPGCTFTRNAAVIEQPGAEVFKGALGFLQTVEGCSAWWWGDVLVAYCDWAIKEAGSRAPRDAEANYVHYTSQWAHLIGRETGTVQEWLQVARFYKAGSRLPALSWAHHQEARVGSAGDVGVALEWLHTAEREGWSKTDLRAKIRRKLRLEAEPDEPMVSIRLQEVLAFNRWSRTQINRIENMDSEELVSIRRELEPAERLIHAIDAKLKPENANA